MSYISDAKIQQMTYRQLGHALTTGELTVKRLKSYYSGARSKAMGRQRTVSRLNKGQFGEIEKESFTKVRNITTTDQLLKEIHDVNKFIRSKKSTITGLKEMRETIMERFSEFNVDEENYPDFIEFLKWFQNSKFVNLIDSDDPELAEAFDSAEAPTPEEWERALNEIIGNREKNS